MVERFNHNGMAVSKHGGRGVFVRSEDYAALATEIARLEREACAKVADRLADEHDSRTGDRIAAAIRARSE